VELEVEEFLHNGDLPSSMLNANSPFRRVLDLGWIVLLRRIVDLECWRYLYGNDCVIVLIVDVDGLHILESAQLPLAAGIDEHRPDRNVVVTQAAVVVEERKCSLQFMRRRLITGLTWLMSISNVFN